MKGLYFLGGAAVGSLITFFAARSHFRKKAEEEIASFRDYYNKKTEEAEETKEAAKNYVDLVVSEGYVPPQDAVATSSAPAVDNDITVPTIYSITEDEYGNEEGYDAIPTYVYYANGILVDETGDELSQDSISRMVGSDFYTRFAGQDCIWLRNTEMKCDFEICADEADFEPMMRQG